MLHLQSQKSFGAGDLRDETTDEFRGTVLQGKELWDARLQGGKDLDMLTKEQRGLLMEHGIHRWRVGGQVDKPNKLN